MAFILGFIVGIIVLLVFMAIGAKEASKSYRKEQPTRAEEFAREWNRFMAWMNTK